MLVDFLLKIEFRKHAYPILGQCPLSILFENIKKPGVLGFNGDTLKELLPDIVYYYMSQDIVCMTCYTNFYHLHYNKL